MKRTLLLLVSITLFLTGSTFAQWVNSSSVPTGSPRSISINGSNILIGSMAGAFSAGGVFKSTDGGTTFTKTAATAGGSVWSVFQAGSNYLAGTDGKGIYLSTDNGTSWTNPLPGKYVRAFTSDAAGNVYAVGYPDGVWRSTDNGASWTTFATPASNLLSVTIIGSTILVGNNSDGIYRSSNGGATWTHPLITVNTNVWSYALIGSTIFANSNMGLYSSIDQGLSWTLVSSPGGGWQANPIVAIGTNLLAGTSTGVQKSTDLGVTWTPVNTGLVSEVDGLAADNQYVYAGAGGYTSPNGFYKRPISEMIFASCVNPTVAGLIAGDQVSCGSFSPALLTSTTPASGETGTMQYKWQSSVSPFSIWVDITASNAAAYSPGVLTQTTKYKRLARVTCKIDWTGAVESNVVTMTVNSIPTVTTANTAKICSGSSPSISLIASVASNFAWTVGTVTGGVSGASGGSGTTINQVLTNVGATAGTVQYLVTPTSVTGTCAGVVYPITVTVNPIKTVSVTISGSQNPTCTGTSINFAAFPTNGGTNPTFVWKVNGSIVGTNVNTYSYTPANGDIVICELTPGVDIICPSTATAISNQVTMVVGISLMPTITIGASSSLICAGGSLNFTASVTNEGTVPTYLWKVNGTTAGTNSSLFTYTAANYIAVTTDVITCQLTSNFPCASVSQVVSNSVNITVNVLPSAGGSIVGAALFTQGTTGIAYSIGTIANVTSYTWLYSGTGATIHGTTAGVTIDFSATATAGTLTAAGTNSCGNGVLSSLILNPNSFLSLKVFLEGPFNGTIGMNTTLNTIPQLIPLTQPYGNVAPWNYTGTESVTAIPAGVVDWVFVEVRQAASPDLATSGTILTKRVGFLKSTGAIVDLDGVSQLNIGHPAITSNLFIVVRHRNHLAIMSATGGTLINGIYTYDFTTALTQAYGMGSGYKQVGTTFAMVSGDINQDGNIFVTDYNEWAIGFGSTTGYFNLDLNMDGNVFVTDYNAWAVNFGSTIVSGLKSAQTRSKYFSAVPQ